MEGVSFKSIAELVLGVAGLLWTIQSWRMARQDKLQKEKEAQFYQQLIDTEKRLAQQILELKESLKAQSTKFSDMGNKFDEMKLQYVETIARHGELLLYLKEHIAKVESMVLSQQREIDRSFGKVVVKD